jgi:hypothetical protein
MNLNPNYINKSKLFLFLGYFGIFIFCKFTIKYLFILFRRRKSLEMYMVTNKCLPLEIKQEKQINYILFNWNAYKHYPELCNKFIGVGYRILFLVSKNQLDELKKKKFTFDLEKFTYLNYDSNWDDIVFSKEISKELDVYNSINNHICIYINKYVEKLELTKQVELLRLVMSKMLKKKGMSLVMSINSARFPEECLLENLHNILSKEYESKIDILNIRTKKDKLRELNYLDLNRIDFDSSKLFIK